MENEASKKLEEIFTGILNISVVKDNIYQQMIGIAVPKMIENSMRVFGASPEEVLEIIRDNIENPEDLRIFIKEFVDFELSEESEEIIKSKLDEIINDSNEEL